MIGDRKIDYSQAHFLDHSFWSCTPGDLRYGGKWTHLLRLWRFRWRDTYGEKRNVATGVVAMTQALAIMSARDRIREVHLIERAELRMVERYVPGTVRSEVVYKREA